MHGWLGTLAGPASSLYELTNSKNGPEPARTIVHCLAWSQLQVSFFVLKRRYQPSLSTAMSRLQQQGPRGAADDF